MLGGVKNSLSDCCCNHLTTQINLSNPRNLWLKYSVSKDSVCQNLNPRCAMYLYPNVLVRSVPLALNSSLENTKFIPGKRCFSNCSIPSSSCSCSACGTDESTFTWYL